jgi:tRNA A37 threonylcarbamoyladenosine dehydratase
MPAHRPEPGAPAAAATACAAAAATAATPDDADLERRFGGLRRLYGDAGYHALRAGRVAVVGVGGVGSWAAEALARSGLAELTLVDLDHVAESNVHRQLQALGATLGQAKVLALRDRLADIHPACRIHPVEAFVDAHNWPALLPAGVDVVIDACDDSRAKLVLARWALAGPTPLVCVGAAGGKTQAQAVAVDDLDQVTHDPLLAALRRRLRATGAGQGAALGSLRCVYSKEPVRRAASTLPGGLLSRSGSAGLLRPPRGADRATGPVLGALNCAGYGSTVTVTATFGLVAAGEAMRLLRERAAPAGPAAAGLADRGEGMAIMAGSAYAGR